MATTTFYTVSNARYFPGTVALLNSLRLTGNAGELVVLDAGLTAAQRGRLDPHTTVLDVPHDVAMNPLLLKAYPASLAPSGVVVVIDGDIIVTGSLSETLDRAAAGAICVYPDTASERWFREWQELFGLTAPLRREPYVNSGFVAFSVEAWPTLLTRWEAAATAIPTERTRAGGALQATPFWDGDQDALNALLMSEIPRGALALLPGDEAPMSFAQRRRLTIRDRERLVCVHEGRETVLVHSAGEPKPWHPDGWRHGMWRDGYVALLPRVLLADDVLVRLSARELPVWSRDGRLPRLLTRCLDYAHAAARHFPKRVRSRGVAAVERIARYEPDEAT
jgi:hypothetical protein